MKREDIGDFIRNYVVKYDYKRTVKAVAMTQSSMLEKIYKDGYQLPDGSDRFEEIINLLQKSPINDDKVWDLRVLIAKSVYDDTELYFSPIYFLNQSIIFLVQATLDGNYKDLYSLAQSMRELGSCANTILGSHNPEYDDDGYALVTAIMESHENT